MTIRYQISNAKNRFILQARSEYGSDSGAPEIFPTFTELVERVANGFGENAFAETVRKSQEMAAAMAAICHSAVAPQLKAIEARVNPGVENVVDDDTPPF